jgi:hypothetical protein
MHEAMAVVCSDTDTKTMLHAHKSFFPVICNSAKHSNFMDNTLLLRFLAIATMFIVVMATCSRNSATVVEVDEPVVGVCEQIVAGDLESPVEETEQQIKNEEMGEAEARAKADKSENFTGRSIAEEHYLFLRGLELYRKDNKKIPALIKSRNVSQVRTHAHKHFQKATFTGSYKCFSHMDAMAICQRFGRPHLYITMTCNSKWPDFIQTRVKKGHSHKDRPVDQCIKYVINYIKKGTDMARSVENKT